jgi:hypothetical protein
MPEKLLETHRSGLVCRDLAVLAVLRIPVVWLLKDVKNMLE